MIVELISVGTEILLGNIVNTNAAYLSEKCAALGLSCYFQSVVGDNEERLTLTLKTAIDRSDIVILSGGLGPSEDDLTKKRWDGILSRITVRIFMLRVLPGKICVKKEYQIYWRTRQKGI